MSEVKTDKLTGVGTAGVILVTGEGNSTTTSLQQGLAKAWINFLGNASSNYIKDSLNISSFNDEATGRYTISYSSSFGNAFYACGGCSSTQRNLHTDTDSLATGSVILEIDDPQGAFADGAQSGCIIMGDLA